MWMWPQYTVLWAPFAGRDKLKGNKKNIVQTDAIS